MTVNEFGTFVVTTSPQLTILRLVIFNSPVNLSCVRVDYSGLNLTGLALAEISQLATNWLFFEDGQPFLSVFYIAIM